MRWNFLRRAIHKSREETGVILEMHKANAVRLRARADLIRASQVEEHADEIHATSAGLYDRNGFAELILDTFDLRK